MLDKVSTLWPELFLLMGAVSCLVTGLHSDRLARKLTPAVAGLSILIALICVPLSSPTHLLDHPLGMHGLPTFVKATVLLIGGVILALMAGLPDRLAPERAQRRELQRGKGFDPGTTAKGEFFAFFLLSLTGVMLVSSATDLVWLFLALELSSLPTYVMIAISRDRGRGHESAIKYFFLGALSAAVFLYGFALIYAATGFTDLGMIAAAVRTDLISTGGVQPLMLAGLVLAVLGLAFKIAAVPCHVYAADVYEGAATSVTAFLAVMPKAAGFVALMLVLGTVGWPLPPTLLALLAVMAVLSMTLGNLLALVQTRLKRVMAYSSIAQSGYMLLGLIGGTAAVSMLDADGSARAFTAGSNGLAAILFYLVSYALATVAALGVFAAAGGHHAEDDRGDSPGDRDEAAHETPTYESLAGLSHRRPWLAAALVIAMLSLTGVPLFAGFIGKVYLAGAVNGIGLWVLIVLLVINSAISAGYYLRIAAAAYLGSPRTRALTLPGNTSPIHVPHPLPPHSLLRWFAVTACTLAVILLGTLFADPLVDAAHHAIFPSVPAAALAEAR